MSSLAAPVYYENAVGKIMTHSSGYALVNYNGTKRDVEQLRVFLQQLGGLLLHRRWQRVLVDVRQIEPLSAAEKLFMIEEWYGRKIARPAYLATCYILAENALARLSVYDIQEVARRCNLSEAFNTLEEAHAYLLTLPM